jgi:predicted deacylase
MKNIKNSKFTICDVTIHPGETASLALPLPEFYSCASFFMPIKIVHGKEAGPCILIFSAVKGDQLNGLEIISRLLESPQLQNIRGTLIAVPVLNVFGLVAPSNESRFERCFPGSVDGSFGNRLAHLFTQEVLSKATHCIELQTGSLNHEILPQIYCNLNDSAARKLAKSFAAPVITNVVTEDNSLRQTTEHLDISLLVYQAGEAMRFNEAAISLGLKGILNVMQSLEMLSENEHTPESSSFKPIFSQNQDWIRAHKSGVLVSNVELGQRIKKGETIGRIKDPFSADTAEQITASHDGVVVGINRHPLIHEGQTIFNVASFIDNHRAGSALEAWGDAQEEES